MVNLNVTSNETWMIEIGLEKSLINELYVSDPSFPSPHPHFYFLAESSTKDNDFYEDSQIHHAHCECIIFLKVSYGILYFNLSP